MLQYTTCAGRDIHIPAVSVIFVENNYIMPKQMSVIAKKILFVYSTVTQDSHLTKSQIVSKMYKDNL